MIGYGKLHLLHKISMSTYLLIITENESLYYLPYNESYN